ncbi:MAG: ComF family protein [Gammaproteobacteria bacterium]|nr:ComF family protein [Gammaproteobacteria bacterium]
MPLGAACKQCATPLPNAQFNLCGYCIKHPAPLDAVFAPYRFEEPLRTIVHDFKYQEKLHLTPFLAEKMLAVQPTLHPKKTCFIPVPLHKKRIHERGFNQAAILATYLAKKLNQPCLLHHIKKIKNTPQQAKLEARTRKKNLQNTFKLKPVPYQHIILIDDLITTGSTANELAYQLKLQDVKHVTLWCIAKTCLN